MKEFIRKVLVLVSFLLLWYIASLFVSPVFVPSPLKVANEFIELIKNGQLGKGFLYSFTRISTASLLSAIVAIPLGLVIFASDVAKDMILPIVNLMRFIPVTAFYPLLIMWFGINEKMKVAFLFLATFVYMLPSVVLALNEVSQELIMTASTLGMSKVQIITTVLLPSSLPSILQTFVMMYGIGWTYIAVCEQINAKYGLGYIIYQSSARGRTSIVFAAIISIMIVSACFDTVSNFLIHKCFAWRFDNDSSE